MDIATIADEDTLLGFKLAGIKDSKEFNPETIKEDLETYKEAKILIVTEKVGQYLRDNDLMPLVKPVLSEIPDKTGSTGAALKNISRLLEEAIGVKLK